MARILYLPSFLTFLALATGIASGDHCCSEKLVGSVTYRLVREGATGIYGCLDDCIYEPVDSPGSLYCFAKGNLTVVCEDKAGEYCSTSQQLATRKITVDIAKEEKDVQILNNALIAVKSWTSDRSWKSIAAYHGKPFQCNRDQTGPGDENGCCIPHWNQGSRIGDFVTWHRMFTYQMEQSLREAETPNNSVAMPYWEWTLPIYNNSLPKFAQQGPWKDGPITPGIGGWASCKRSNTNRSSNPSFPHHKLACKVKKAYCMKTFETFNQYINYPHNDVHRWTGGSMKTEECAAYDPIFFLHHSNVDRQYAFYQELQKELGKQIKARHVPMFPFADPNTPCNISTDHSKGDQTLDYKADFRYEYDSLTFTINHTLNNYTTYTPKQFADDYSLLCKGEALFAAIPLKYTGITSTIKYKINPTGEDVEINTFGSGGKPASYIYQNYDLIHVEHCKHKHQINDGNIKFDIFSYTDASGEPLPTEELFESVVAYKPQGSDKYIYRLHEHKLANYAPTMYGEQGSKIELYEEDGTRSSLNITDGPTGIVLDKDNVTIVDQEHTFIFGEQSITFGFRPDF